MLAWKARARHSRRIDAATGLTTATVDATLTLPAAARTTEAAMLRELLQRLTR